MFPDEDCLSLRLAIFCVPQSGAALAPRLAFSDVYLHPYYIFCLFQLSQGVMLCFVGIRCEYLSHSDTVICGWSVRI